MSIELRRLSSQPHERQRLPRAWAPGVNVSQEALLAVKPLEVKLTLDSLESDLEVLRQ